jgi:predicted phosphoadenosine phosphosulfate sulfurtransferase
VSALSGMKIYTKEAVEGSVLDLAYARIEQAYDLYDQIAVSFSGGKDSTVCLQLTLDIARKRNRLPLRVFFSDEEAIPYQTEEYMRRVAASPDIALEWYCLPVKHRNACSKLSPWWSPWDRADQDVWVRPLPPEGITELAGFPFDREPRDRYTWPEMDGLLHPPAKGSIGIILGLRAEESLTRYRAVAHKLQENYLMASISPTARGNIWKVYPIYDWKTEDVWTAPAKFGWDYNRAYDVMDQCGIAANAQRCSPAYGEEPLRGFYLYKQCFPEIWDKMSVRVPGANAALLYGRTDLWGFGPAQEKPEELTWEEFTMAAIEKFGPKERKLIAKSISGCIRTHFKKTRDPILSEVPHPITGVSWKFLYIIAARGDLKDRRASAMTGNATGKYGGDMVSAYAFYETARAAEGK